MLWFPSAQPALDTCLALLERFELFSEETMQPLWVRQTQHRDDLIGHDVNLVSRIADQAGPLPSC